MESQTRNTESLDSRLGIGLGIGLDVKPCIESDSESDSKFRPGQYQSRNRDSKIGTQETLLPKVKTHHKSWTKKRFSVQAWRSIGVETGNHLHLYITVIIFPLKR